MKVGGFGEDGSPGLPMHLALHRNRPAAAFLPQHGSVLTASSRELWPPAGCQARPLTSLLGPCNPGDWMGRVGRSRHPSARAAVQMSELLCRENTQGPRARRSLGLEPGTGRSRGVQGSPPPPVLPGQQGPERPGPQLHSDRTGSW